MYTAEELLSRTKKRLSRVLRNRQNDHINSYEFGASVFEIIYISVATADFDLLPRETSAFAALDMFTPDLLREVDDFAERRLRPEGYPLDYPPRGYLPDFPAGPPAPVLSKDQKCRMDALHREQLVAVHEKIKALLKNG